MKKVRAFSKHPVIVVIISFSILFVSCGKDKFIASPSFTGEEIMSAIFFGDGSAVDFLPEIKNSIDINLFIQDSIQLNEVRTLYGQILNKVEENEPGAFEDFRKKMTSGDHIVIQETILAYGIKMSKIIETELKDVIDYSKLENNKSKVIQIVKKYNLHPADQNTLRLLEEDQGFQTEMQNLFEEVKENSLKGSPTDEMGVRQIAYW